MLNGERKQFNTDSSFSFAVPQGRQYNFTVEQSPADQVCIVSSKIVIANANQSNLIVTCGPAVGSNAVTISGQITGLNGTLYLRMNSGVWRDFTSSGAFSYSVQPDLYKYVAIHLKNPDGQVCSSNKPSEFIVSGDVNDVVITCTATQPTSDNVTVSGSITGLVGGMIELEVNDERKQFSSNTGFSFSAPRNSTYYFSIMQKPDNQHCSVNVERGSTGSGRSDLIVTCTTTQTVPDTVTVAGSITGLSGGTLELQVLGEKKRFTASGPFSFTVTEAGTYTLTLTEQPASAVCSVEGGQSVVPTNTAITITCTSTSGSGSGGDTSERMTVAMLLSKLPANSLTECIQDSASHAGYYVDQVKTLKCTNSISSVEALSYYPELTYLELNDSSFSSIDTLQYLTKLESLHLHSVSLSSIDLSKNTQLDEVMIVNAGLVEVDISALALLTKLDLSNNNLNTINVFARTNLTHLKLDGNPNLKRLDISHLSKLEAANFFPPAYLDELWVTLKGRIVGANDSVRLTLGTSTRILNPLYPYEFGLLAHNNQAYTISVDSSPEGQTCTFDGPATFTPKANVVLNINCQ